MQQHDAQELLIVLISNMEEELLTSSNNKINKQNDNKNYIEQYCQFNKTIFN